MHAHKHAAHSADHCPGRRSAGSSSFLSKLKPAFASFLSSSRSIPVTLPTRWERPASSFSGPGGINSFGFEVSLWPRRWWFQLTAASFAEVTQGGGGSKMWSPNSRSNRSCWGFYLLLGSKLFVAPWSDGTQCRHLAVNVQVLKADFSCREANENVFIHETVMPEFTGGNLAFQFKYETDGVTSTPGQGINHTVAFDARVTLMLQGPTVQPSVRHSVPCSADSLIAMQHVT